MNARERLGGLGLVRYAEVFELLGIHPRDVPQLTEPDLIELGVVSPEHRCRIRRGAGATAEDPKPLVSELPESLAERVLTRFLFPIAYGYRKVIEQESPSHAIGGVFCTYNALLRFTALTFLAQFLSGNHLHPTTSGSPVLVGGGARMFSSARRDRTVAAGPERGGSSGRCR